MSQLTPWLTAAGKALQVRAQYGETITFTKIVVGNGTPEGDPEEATEMANPLLDIGISEITLHDGYALLTGQTRSSEIDASFYGHELGVYAKGSDDVEVLHSYWYSEDGADFFPTAVSGMALELTMAIAVIIGNTENVTAILIEGDVYALKEDFDNHVENQSNPHNVTAAQIGLGSVPNVSTNDQTPTYTPAANLSALVSGETLSVAFAKLAKAVTDLINHIGNHNNPHQVKAAQIGAAPTSHNHSAAQITSGTLGVVRGGTGYSSVDNTPTAGSKKMVTSGGVYTALAGKANYSHNHAVDQITGVLPVTKGGTGYNSVDSTPTANSAKMVTSGGIKNYVDRKISDPETGAVTNLGKLKFGSVCLIFGTRQNVPINLNNQAPAASGGWFYGDFSIDVSGFDITDVSTVIAQIVGGSTAVYRVVSDGNTKSGGKLATLKFRAYVNTTAAVSQNFNVAILAMGY